MTIRNTYSAEAWDKVYDAFQQINFTAYDYDTVKESLLQYLKIYHAEHFNDFIESSELIAILELFAYVAELLAYRVDVMSHENFITTAQRKQSILRLARLISYRASRNIPGRGLAKITSIRTSEQLFDSLGNNLANTTITWNDPNNSNWKEQFFLVINKALTTRFGQPQKSFQIGDVTMQLYTFNHAADAFVNGVYPFITAGSVDSIPMEVVPANLDDNGPFERAPDLNSQMGIIYASDGKGDGSDYTGFLLFVKQGTLIRTDYLISEPTENRRIELDSVNVNDTDVWVYRVDDNNRIIENWKRVETLDEQNLFFNDDNSTRKKYEVESLENDRIALLFGDNNMSDAPVGNFQLWTRVSLNQNITIPKNRIANQPMSFNYASQNNSIETLSLTFSLTTAIQNNSASETIEHIRKAAPTTYYAQNRMVNGQDYNTFMLKDSTILKLKTINRTFAGQPKYIEWNDASRRYENIKLFGDDLKMYQEIQLGQFSTTFSSKILIRSFIEPLLQNTGVINSLIHACAATHGGYGIISNPRRRFIEDNQVIYRDLNNNPVTPYGTVIPSDVTAGSLNEKSAIQSALDRHWFGDPEGFVTISGKTHGIIPDITVDPTNDGKLYDENLPRTIDGINSYPPGDIGSGLQSSPNYKYFGLKFNRFLKALGNGTIDLLDFSSPTATSYGLGPVTIPDNRAAGAFYLRTEVFTIELQSDKTTFSVTSNIRGKLPDYSIALPAAPRYLDQNPSAPINFAIIQGSIEFSPGDAFIVDVKRVQLVPSTAQFEWRATVRSIEGNYAVNLNGWWQIIPQPVLQSAPYNLFGAPNEGGPSTLQAIDFDPNDPVSSWVILIAREDDSLGEPKSWTVFYRDMKLIAESPTTKFWYNQSSKILDQETLKPVVDKIKILRSNLDADGLPLPKNEVYDVVGFVYDADGNVSTNKLEIIPTDTDGFVNASEALPDNVLQFYEFSRASYEYFLVDLNTGEMSSVGCNDMVSLAPIGYDYTVYDAAGYEGYQVTIGADAYNPLSVTINASKTFSFSQGNFLDTATEPVPLLNAEGEPVYDGGNPVLVAGQYLFGVIINGKSYNGTYRMLRRRMVPAPFRLATTNGIDVIYKCQSDIGGLDFMWQHFSPDTNLIDPSVTNIHDAFVMTRGYYNNMMDFVKGFSSVEPTPPTPLELRTSYGYLLQNKMLSDTVVLHSGKIKLLFGELADPQLRAKFRVVRSPSASFSNERIKLEIVSVIDTFFDINNWDFGDRFYATELLALIHQRLTTQIASVVLVPTYSVNSFGSLFTIDSGFDEILQSCASVNDVEIVDALTPTVLRQYR